MTQKRERDKNVYAGNCVDCHAFVEAGQGRLYRYHGAAANLKGYRVPRGQKYAYIVRCESCYTRHDVEVRA